MGNHLVSFVSNEEVGWRVGGGGKDWKSEFYVQGRVYGKEVTLSSCRRRLERVVRDSEVRECGSAARVHDNYYTLYSRNLRDIACANSSCNIRACV